MENDLDDRQAVLKALAATPRRLASLSQKVEIEPLHFRHAADDWSANDILARLRSCADVWGKGIQAMISQVHPTMRYVSPRAFIKKTEYPALDFAASLREFAEQRSALLKSLKALSDEGWRRGATFTGTTKGREQTVLSYAQRIARHEDEHCQQIAAMLKQP